MSEENKKNVVSVITDTADQTSSMDKNDIEKNKVMAILAYFGILVLIPILAAKDSKFAQFHANQGLLVFILSIAISILSAIVSFLGILSIATLALAIIGIVNAAQGKAKELPFIGKYRILK